MSKKHIISILYSILILLVSAIIVNSCQHESVKKNEFRKIVFETEVLPIIQNNCTAAGCHSGSGELFALTNYDQIVKQVTKGDASVSNLYMAITSTYGDLMPPNKPLTPQQRAIIRLWIDQGAENTVDTGSTIPTTPKDTAKIISLSVCFTRDILPILQSNCSSCHSNLSNYNGALNWTSPGNPNNSKIYKAITDNEEDRMPPSPRNKLIKSNIDSIYSWIVSGAKNEKCVASCDTTKFLFGNDVYPIIESNCTSCHSASHASGGINLTNYNNVLAVSGNGKLIGVMNKTGNYPQMPPSGKLSDCNIKKVEKWVNAGSKND